MSNLVDPPIREGAKITVKDAAFIRPGADRLVARQDMKVNGLVPVVMSSTTTNVLHAIRGRATQPLPMFDSKDEKGTVIRTPYDVNVFSRFVSHVDEHFGAYYGVWDHLLGRYVVPRFVVCTFDKWLARYTETQRKMITAELALYMTGRLSTKRLYRRGMFTKV